ncbi:MAG TPA: phosphoadenylyl-sulfate reductase [Acidimicrobiaceae bacterium]|nr:phosphoadenylyl-sulfate reductase [Acidimicrobiaceae bacterium]
MAVTLPFPSQRHSFTDDELVEVNAELEHAPASKIIAWAAEAFGPHLCLTASMNDAVLIDLAVKVDPAIEVVFIDTGYHFPETLATVETVRRRYGLNMKIMTAPENTELLWKTDPDNCCSALKVQQLDRALAGKAAWMSGIRRAEADTRATAHVVGRDLRGLVKVNPIAQWTDADVEAYIEAHDVPFNPLLAQGYGSIGCMPCTEKVAPGEDARAGRWRGKSKTECGLHG